MNRSLTFPFLSLLFGLLMTLACTGCMGKTSPAEESILEEELYIDAKMGFTVLHPLPWERLKIPVSSPSYRQDSVAWEIPDEEEPGRMLIRTYPILATAAELPDLPKSFLENKQEHSSGETESFIHAAGEAVAVTVNFLNHTERVYAIQGKKQAYILSFYLNTVNFAEQSSLFERISKSFREL